LQPFFEGNAWTSPISELRACYLAIPGAIKHIRQHRGPRRGPAQRPDEDLVPVPEDAHGFSRFIGEYILELQKLPRDALLELHEKASSDLECIEVNIKDCERRIRSYGGDPKTKKGLNRLWAMLAPLARTSPGCKYLAITRT
jgi:hypothetical protein